MFETEKELKSPESWEERIQADDLNSSVELAEHLSVQMSLI